MSRCRGCRRPMPRERVAISAVYCSPRCRYKRCPARRRQVKRHNERRRWGTPYWRFAHSVKRPIAVPADAEQQATARRMIAAGWCGYENRAGLITAVGEPIAGRLSTLVFAHPEPDLADELEARTTQQEGSPHDP